MMVICGTHLKSASWKAVTVLKRPKMVLTALVSKSGKYRMVSELKLTFACSNAKCEYRGAYSSVYV